MSHPGAVMPQYVKGPMPIAVILCRFRDVLLPNHHPKYYHDFVSSSGHGGLFDYWRDISYHNIDLSGSEVFGWFTMRHSFSFDIIEGVGQAEKTRSFWMKEGRRLAEENVVDLPRFRVVMIVVNAPVGTAWEGNTCLLDLDCWGQGGWKWCQRCHLLAYSGDGKIGKCLEGGEHDHPPSSTDFGLPVNNTGSLRQSGWRKCRKCRCLFYGERDPGKCHGGFSHDFSRSSNYSLSTAPMGLSSEGWKWCCKCEGLVYPATTRSACSAKGFHETRASSGYHLVQAGSNFNATQGAHQTGHTLLGISAHAMLGPENNGENCWDIMAGGFENKNSHDAGQYGRAGPGLSAASLTKLGWIPEDRIFTFTKPNNIKKIVTHYAELKLVPLNAPEQNGYLAARIPSPGHVYTVELRKATHWDAGIGQTAVLIHELRSEYTTVTKGWRACRICHALTDVRTAVCPAGSFHDHSQSGHYKLPHSSSKNNGWHPCTKCQSLVHHTTPSVPCPAHGVHRLDFSKKFTLTPSNPNVEGQPGWKCCNKCHVLSFTGHSGTKGACPCGGTHQHSRSPDYTLLHNTPDSVPAGTKCEENWRWCRKCECLAYAGYSLCGSGGPHDLSGSMDYALKELAFRHPYRAHLACKKCFCVFRSRILGCGPCASGGDHSSYGTPLTLAPTTIRTESNGQSGWRFCDKCHLLLYSPGSPEHCAAGGEHDLQKSSDYRIACFSMDNTYLIGTNWIGTAFVDAARGIKISVGDQLDEEGRALIKLSWK